MRLCAIHIDEGKGAATSGCSSQCVSWPSMPRLRNWCRGRWNQVLTYGTDWSI